MIGGLNGPVVVLSAETAHVLNARFKSDLARLRVAARGRNPRVAQELLDLHEVALRFQPDPGSGVPELEPAFDANGRLLEQWMSPGAVADLLGLTDRGVRKACADGRLEAEQDDRHRWQIRRSAAVEFGRTRDAAKEHQHGTT